MPPKVNKLMFAQRYAETGNGTAAIKYAGFTGVSAGVEASKLLKNEEVAAMIAQIKADAMKESAYTLKVAMDEAKAVCEFAIKTKNANAYAKAVELRSKLSGLLIEKHQVQQLGNFSIQIDIGPPPSMLPAPKVVVPQIDAVEAEIVETAEAVDKPEVDPFS